MARRKFISLFIGIAFVPLNAPSASASPKFVDDYLAGRHVLKSPPLDRFDPKSGYYLLDERHDGGRLVLVTSPEFAGYESDRAGEMQEFADSFPHGPLLLATGKGAKIGSTVGYVKHLLGPPTSIDPMEGDKQGCWLHYDYTYVVHKRKRFYEATYTFEHNKLWAIEIVDTPPGW